MRLLYRRAYRATAVTKGWDLTPGGFPVEIEMARQELAVGVEANPLEIPAAGTFGLLLLAGLLGSAAVFKVRTG